MVEATEEPKADVTTEDPKTEPAKAEPDKSKDDLAKRYDVLDRRQTQVQKREQAAEKRAQTVAQAAARLEARFGDPEAAKKAYDAKEYHAAARYIQRIFGDDFALITQKIARATSGMDPAKLKELEDREQLEREKREWQASKERETKDKASQTTREGALKVVTEKCAGHDVLKLRNGSDLVLRALEDSWDSAANGFKLTFKQAADQVVAEKLAEAEALGAKRAGAKLVEEKTTKPPAPKAALVAATAGVRELKRSGKKALSFEERHALAARLMAKRRAT